MKTNRKSTLLKSLKKLDQTIEQWTQFFIRQLEEFDQKKANHNG